MSFRLPWPSAHWAGCFPALLLIRCAPARWFFVETFWVRRATWARRRLSHLPLFDYSAWARWLFLSFLQPILLFRILLTLVLWERFAGVRAVANAIWWGLSKPPLFPPPWSLNLLIYPFFLILALFLVFVIFSIFQGDSSASTPNLCGRLGTDWRIPPHFLKQAQSGVWHTFPSPHSPTPVGEVSSALRG